MKKLLYALLVISLLAGIPIAALADEGEVTTNQGKVSMDRLIDQGWTCAPIGEWHCFNPASGKKEAPASITVRVFTPDDHPNPRKFLGTEILWRADIYGGQPCPQDHLLTPEDLHMPYYACHHYSHGG